MAKQNQKFNSVDNLLAGTERLFLLVVDRSAAGGRALFTGLVGQPGHSQAKKT